MDSLLQEYFTMSNRPLWQNDQPPQYESTPDYPRYESPKRMPVYDKLPAPGKKTVVTGLLSIALGVAVIAGYQPVPSVVIDAGSAVNMMLDGIMFITTRLGLGAILSGWRSG